MIEKFYEQDFFNDKKPNDIRKYSPVVVRVPEDISLKGLVRVINGLNYNEHLEISETYKKIIPTYWIEFYNKKFPKKEIKQNELANHGEICLIKLGGNPLDILKFYLTERKLPYPYYGWTDKNGISIRFRIASIFEAWNQYKDLEIIDKKIEIKGCGKEISCSVPSRSQENVIYHEFPIIDLPNGTEEDEWMNTKAMCDCEYNKFGAYIHYYNEWCVHGIQVLWEAKIQGFVPYNMFPKPTEEGEEFQRKLKDNVIIGNRNLTFTEKDAILQEADLEKLLDFLN